MAQSKYDTDGDGVCDDPVCDDVIALGVQQDPGPKVMALFIDNVQAARDHHHAEAARRSGRSTPSASRRRTSSRSAWTVGWLQDYPDAYTFGPPLFGAASLYPGVLQLLSSWERRPIS